MPSRVPVAIVLSAALGLAPTASPAAPLVRAITDGGPPAAIRALGSAPLAFVRNEGQVDGAVAYYLPGRDKTLYFTAEGVTLRLRGEAPGAGSHVMKLDFAGARSVRPEGVDPAGTTYSFFSGPRSGWKTAVPAFRKLVYRDLWLGIDLEYSGDADRLKYQFVVRPGADPSVIRLAWRGAVDLRTLPDGRLEVAAPGVSFADGAPIAWQERDGARLPVQMAYAVGEADGRSDARAFSFRVGSYDPALPLVLDPAILVYCGYLGGNESDFVTAMAVAPSGAVYVAGYTQSVNGTFPATVGPDLTHNGGTEDAFVARVKADGSGLDWCGFIGGGSVDQAHALAIDPDGNAYVAGYTSSDENTFPVTVGPDVTYNGGTYDAFVARVRADGTSLDWCGYVGGSGYDQARAVAVDATGNVFLTGYTGSTEASFPVSVGPDLTYNGSDYDVFVARVHAGGSALDWCGYVGGAGNEYAYGIARTGDGDLLVVGHTGSTETSFPVSVGPDLTHGLQSDAFVARVKGDGTALEHCGFIGGDGHDYLYGVAADAQGRAVVTGTTSSTEGAGFPVSVGPDLTYNGGEFDGFVARVAADGSGLDYCGYIGGAAREEGRGVVLDPQGRPVVAGITQSDEATFPALRGPDLTFNGNDDGFVSRVTADGSALVFASYVGGTQWDGGLAVGADAAGYVYTAGYAYSNHTTNAFPVVTGPDLTFNGSYDGFVARLLVNEPPVLDAIGARQVYEGQNLQFTVTADDVDTGDEVTLSAEGPPAVVAGFNPATGVFSWTPGHDQVGQHQVTFRAGDGAPQSTPDEETVTITVLERLRVTGRVKTGGGQPLRAVKIKLLAADGVTLLASVKTDAQGRYAHTGLLPGSYVVKPSKYGWRFKPTQRAVTLVADDVALGRFVASPK